MTKFPHYLVAGWTGGGKSNYLHSVLTTLAHYNNVELYIIDLKRMEFNTYTKYAEVAYKTDHALDLLRRLRKELDRRMDLLSLAGVNNIRNYKGDLPYIVLVVDEFSQLSPILVKNKEEKDKRSECHQYLVDLICLARAVGIHIILSTQRPDKDILPGQLKANISAVMCFRTKNTVNSLICLDNEKAAYIPADIPGRGIFQWDTEREVQTWFVEKPGKLLPKIPLTKPVYEEVAPVLEPC